MPAKTQTAPPAVQELVLDPEPSTAALQTITSASLQVQHQRSWLDDPEKVQLIKNTIAVGTSDDELALFLEVCRATGLNPFQRQIFCIMRKEWDDETRTKKPKMTIQTSIDGYRLIASRTGQHAGTEDAEIGYLNDRVFPDWAKTTVYRLMPTGHVAKFTATARWEEYCQVNRDGEVIGLWAKMPVTMLAKCSEALALRKGFPQELSGIYTREEMMQAENPDARELPPPVSDRAPRPSKALAPSNPPDPPKAPAITPDWKEKLEGLGVLDLPATKGLAKLLGASDDAWSDEVGTEVLVYIRGFVRLLIKAGYTTEKAMTSVRDFITFVDAVGGFSTVDHNALTNLVDEYTYAVRKSEEAEA